MTWLTCFLANTLNAIYSFIMQMICCSTFGILKVLEIFAWHTIIIDNLIMCPAQKLSRVRRFGFEHLA